MIAMSKRPGMFRTRTEAAFWLGLWFMIAVTTVGSFVVIFLWLIGVL